MVRSDRVKFGGPSEEHLIEAPGDANDVFGGGIEGEDCVG